MSDNLNSLTSASESMSIEALRYAFKDDESDKETNEKEEKGQEEGLLDPEDKPEDKSLEKEADTDNADSTEDSDDESSKEDSDEDKEPEVLETPGEVNFKVKKFTLQVGDGTQEVPNDAVIEIPVDGGVKKLHLQEVINRASGDVSVQNRITEVEQTRQELEELKVAQEELFIKKVAEIEKKEEVLAKFVKLSTEGKPEDLLAYCAKKIGKNPVDVINEFLDSCTQWGKALDVMTPEDRARWSNGVALALREQELTEKEEKTKAAELEEQAKKEKDELAKFAQDELVKADVAPKELSDMIQYLKKEGRELEAEDDKGKLKEVLEYIHEDRVVKAANEVDSSLLLDANRELLQSIYDFTLVKKIRKIEDIKKVLAQHVEAQEKKEEQRIAENLSKKSPKEKTTKTSKANDSDEVPILTLNQYLSKRIG